MGGGGLKGMLAPLSNYCPPTHPPTPHPALPAPMLLMSNTSTFAAQGSYNNLLKNKNRQSRTHTVTDPCVSVVLSTCVTGQRGSARLEPTPSGLLHMYYDLDVICNRPEGSAWHVLQNITATSTSIDVPHVQERGITNRLQLQ